MSDQIEIKDPQAQNVMKTAVAEVFADVESHQAEEQKEMRQYYERTSKIAVRAARMQLNDLANRVKKSQKLHTEQLKTDLKEVFSNMVKSMVDQDESEDEVAFTQLKMSQQKANESIESILNPEKRRTAKARDKLKTQCALEGVKFRNFLKDLVDL